jgi:cation-dependent mannose-6-phosphate receptor
LLTFSLFSILCLASAYLIGGFLFMRIKRGARGIDQIPHLEMWRKLGNLSADGCDYCCRCNTNASRTGYFFDESTSDMRGDDDILAP